MTFPKHHRQQQEYQQQREEMFKQQAEERNKKNKTRKTIIYSVVVVFLLLTGGSITGYYLTPGPWDSFAKCLTEKGAVMYGAMSSCPFTRAQANMFGKSFKHINYKDEKELPGLKTRPTWTYQGKRYETVQSFQTLAAVTGCKY